jgi:hypothetical protein
MPDRFFHGVRNAAIISAAFWLAVLWWVTR